jgi:ATP-binding cassette subfamily B (MDR/TAP) protein 9
MENVTFTYPARPGAVVLKGLDLHVPNGQVVALVGPSGGGKSSCMRLIQHYYEPSAGRVLISGRPVEQFDPVWLRRHVAIVGQEPTLFARSIRRNIIYGLEGTVDEPSQADIEEAALQSNAHEFIMKMPKGYDTQVGERGVQLSGGQKQRIALARSLVRKPKVLLLDEATSALDTESEAVVQAALDKVMKQQGRTVLVIAHRLSTVKNADLIVCIADGKVAEKGTHDELVAKQGVYATLVQKQIEGMAQAEEHKDTTTTAAAAAAAGSETTTV